jgi:hypothetical protein
MKILLDTHIFLLALAQFQRAIRDCNTQLGAIALLISSVIVLPRVRYVSRAIEH